MLPVATMFSCIERPRWRRQNSHCMRNPRYSASTGPRSTHDLVDGSAVSEHAGLRVVEPFLCPVHGPEHTTRVWCKVRREQPPWCLRGRGRPQDDGGLEDDGRRCLQELGAGSANRSSMASIVSAHASASEEAELLNLVGFLP